MKRKSIRLLAATGLILGAGGVLVACGGSSASSTNTYSYVYMNDPNTLDYIQTNRATTSDIVGNLVDGLLGNDQYGNFTPALAESWTVSADGLTYTYKLRKDAKWYTSDGEEYANVTADDFVTGIQHAVDSQSEALYLIQDSIKGLDDYVKGKTKDFSTVGVKAVDKYTVQYTLAKPEPYWNTKTTTTILYPVNADFLKSKGKDFGKTDPSSILYNGPYLLKAYTAKSSIEYAKNQNYWDKDNVKIDSVKLAYSDGSDPESYVRNFSDGAYTEARLYPNTSSFASVEKQYKDNIVYGPQDGSTFYYQFNLDRKAESHTAKKTDAEKESTKQAILNKDFRQAINFALDRTSFVAQSNGKTGANRSLRNSLVPPTFVQIGNQTFGQVVQNDLASYGDEWKDVKLDDAQDGLYNPEKAKAEFAKAKETLQGQGVQFPIHLDVPVPQTDKNLVAQAQSFKQSVENTLGKDNVVIDVLQMSEQEQQNITYFADAASQKDYDLHISGWGPDYQDPSTYLDILNPDNGSILANIGLEAGKDQDVVNAVGLNDYKKLIEDAGAEKTDVTARYTKYAAAQAWLTDSSILLPVRSNGGNPLVTKVTPFTKAYSLVGVKGDTNVYKYMEVQSDIVKASDYEKALKKWQTDVKTSQEKAQENLAKHVAK